MAHLRKWQTRERKPRQYPAVIRREHAMGGTCTNGDCSRWLERKGYHRLAANKRPCVLCEANERAASRSGILDTQPTTEIKGP